MSESPAFGPVAGEKIANVCLRMFLSINRKLALPLELAILTLVVGKCFRANRSKLVFGQSTLQRSEANAA